MPFYPCTAGLEKQLSHSLRLRHGNASSMQRCASVHPVTSGWVVRTHALVQPNWGSLARCLCNWVAVSVAIGGFLFCRVSEVIHVVSNGISNVPIYFRITVCQCRDTFPICCWTTTSYVYIRIYTVYVCTDIPRSMMTQPIVGMMLPKKVVKSSENKQWGN